MTNEILKETITLVKEILSEEIEEIKVERAVIGVFFSGVVLSTHSGGIAATPIKEIPEAVCCPSSASEMPMAGKLTEKPVLKYLDDIFSQKPMKKALGIAVLSALSNYCWEKGFFNYLDRKMSVDAIDCIEVEKYNHPVVIGAIIPFLRLMKMNEKDYTVIELDKRALKGDELDHFAPVEKTDEIVPKADLLVITATTLINGTLEHILEIANPEAKVIVLGPTASLAPHAFFKRGVDILGGDYITNPNKMLDSLAEGGSGYHFYGNSAEQIVVINKN